MLLLNLILLRELDPDMFDLHFNMLLLNRTGRSSILHLQWGFTFQYASIKPGRLGFDLFDFEHLHFNMLLLNLVICTKCIVFKQNLHFNMLLLNLGKPKNTYKPFKDLHFNMLLLNLKIFSKFHLTSLHLHFNMLLLNRIRLVAN